LFLTRIVAQLQTLRRSMAEFLLPNAIQFATALLDVELTPSGTQSDHWWGLAHPR
jgi:hypothetical protein